MIDDFGDVLREFVAHQVIFLVVGAHALAVHGVARATGDLDIQGPDGSSQLALKTPSQRLSAPRPP